MVRQVTARALDVVPAGTPADDTTILAGAAYAPPAPGTVSEAVIDAVAKIRENIVLRRALKAEVAPGTGIVSA